MTNEITWGDTVLVSQNAPAEFQPGSHGSVSGFRDLERDVKSSDIDSPSGQRLYLIEFPDGTAIEIPAAFLIKATDG